MKDKTTTELLYELAFELETMLWQLDPPKGVIEKELWAGIIKTRNIVTELEERDKDDVI